MDNGQHVRHDDANPTEVDMAGPPQLRKEEVLVASTIALDPDSGRPYVQEGANDATITQAVSNAGN